MSLEMVSFLKSLIFIGMMLIATGICIPKSVKSWTLWREKKNSTHLTNAIICAIAAFFLLSGNFVIFIRAVGGYNV